MRFYVGISSLVISITIIIFSILFFDYSDLFEKLFSFVLLIFSSYLLFIAFQYLNSFYCYKRLLVKGLKVKAKVIDIKRSIFSINNSPNYIIEVVYEHPKSHEHFKTFVDCYQLKKWNKSKLNKDDVVEIVVDPNNPSIALLT